MMKERQINFYERLGISYQATQEEIVKAYYHLVQKYHPFICPLVGSLERMQYINEAYEILSDLAKRKEYDKNLHFLRENNQAYESYSKKKEEMEEDFADWLKNYLKKRRNLDNLYQEYIKIEGKNCRYRMAHITPNPLDIIKSKKLYNQIKLELRKMIKSYNEDIIIVLEFLFAELKTPKYRISLMQKDGLNPEVSSQLIQIIIMSELILFVNKFYNSNSDRWEEFTHYVLEKYENIRRKNKNCLRNYTRPEYADELIENILENIILNNPEKIKKTLNLRK